MNFRLNFLKQSCLLLVLFFTSGSQAMAASSIDSLLSIVDTTTDTLVADALYDEAKSYYNKDIDSSLYLALQSAKLSERLKYHQGCINAYRGISAIGPRAGNNDIALEYIEAGRVSFTGNGLFTASFKEDFASPPVVFLMFDNSETNSGINPVHLHSATTTSEFQIRHNTSFALTKDVFWIAMEEGQYNTEKYKWYAVRQGWTNPSSTTDTIILPIAFFNHTPNGGVMTPESTGFPSLSIRESNKDTILIQRYIDLNQASHLLFWEEKN